MWPRTASIIARSVSKTKAKFVPELSPTISIGVLFTVDVVVVDNEEAAAFEETAGADGEPSIDTGRRYRETILEVGGSRPAMESFKAFRGREPQLDALLRHSRAYSGYAPIIGTPWLTAFAHRSPFAETFRSSAQSATGTSRLRAELNALPQEEWPTRLRRLISDQISLILLRNVDPDRPLAEYGLDSLGALELRTRIEAETGIRLAAKDLGVGTVRGLSELLCEKLVAANSG
jgi:acyl carrier protein